MCNRNSESPNLCRFDELSPRRRRRIGAQKGRDWLAQFLLLSTPMRLSLSNRLTLSLLACVAIVSLSFATYQTMEEVRGLRDEVRRQSLAVGEAQSQPAEQMLAVGAVADLQDMVNRYHPPGHLYGIAIYDSEGHPVAAPPGLKTPAFVTRAAATGQTRAQFFDASGELMYAYFLPLRNGNRMQGGIGVYEHAGFVIRPIWRHAAIAAFQTLLIAGLTLLVVRRGVGQPLQHVALWLRDARMGSGKARRELPKGDMFKPLTREMERIATSLNAARAAAEEEARLREASLALWTPERLRVTMRARLGGARLFAVSNREPYEHTRNGSLKWAMPASGLVTALEPVLRACDGTWVAQGTGSADREAADEHGRLRVPPDHPQYTLRRVWLTEEEEEGFYFGFANEGLWPLCHVAHMRPMFRSDDWKMYQAVNVKFANALLEEMEGENDPLVLVQDYHFALLPRLIKERRPDARVAIFWHIPWPNPEAFSICPWERDLLEGMLGADLIGFHIQAHCNNFLDTVDHALQSRIDREHFAVGRNEHSTAVRPFPISVAFVGDGPVAEDQDMEHNLEERAALLRRIGTEAEVIGLGVDRVDYTKGIPERFRGVERFLEQYPKYRGKLAFIQIGAPSRTHIKRYQDLMAEVTAEADRINRRFQTDNWRPITFLKRHHTHQEIQPFYRQADFCMVTSLHDGMNLVAKEYIAARADELGALILSRFTGASHELADALVVNPYDTDELAGAIHRALVMPLAEKRQRMSVMRAVIKESNVYRWAGNLIGELASVRLDATAAADG